MISVFVPWPKPGTELGPFLQHHLRQSYINEAVGLLSDMGLALDRGENEVVGVYVAPAAHTK